MGIQFEVSEVFPVSPETVYSAWLSTRAHSGMTGSPAQVSEMVGETFQAWDGYIEGKNLELEPPSRILQSWRTSEFEESDEDSRLEVLFAPERSGTRVTIRHSGLPEHGMQYRQGWIDAYFVPMRAYFADKSG